MGVMSELIHPLDLTDFLFGFEKWNFGVGFAHSSDFAHTQNVLDDSVHCELVADGCIVSCHSSFAWHQRRREIIAFLSDGNGGCFQSVLTFDKPLWDCDSLSIWRLNSNTGKRDLILERNYDNSDYPTGQYQVGKLHKFIMDGIGESNIQNRKVDYRAAFRLNEIMEQISFGIQRNGRPYGHPPFIGNPVQFSIR
jgi:predicted dehydrogenase